MFAKYLQLVRSPIERTFSRLHSYRIIKWCGLRATLCHQFVHLVALVDSLKCSQPQSQWVHTRESPLQRNEVDPKDVGNATMSLLEQHPEVDLRGRASSKRANGAPAFKEARLEYESKCKRCEQPRSACACPQREREAAVVDEVEPKQYPIAAPLAPPMAQPPRAVPEEFAGVS